EDHGLPTRAERGRFLTRQRGFSARDGDVVVTEVKALARLTEHPAVDVVLLQVEAGGVPGAYQLALERPGEPVERLEHVRIGTRPVYDALHDRDVTSVWPRLVADEAVVDELRFHRVRGAEAAIVLDRPSLVFTGEQSNTTVA